MCTPTLGNPAFYSVCSGYHMISQIWSLRNRQRVLQKITTNQNEELQSPVPVDTSTQPPPHLRLRNKGKELIFYFYLLVWIFLRNDLPM